MENQLQSVQMEEVSGKTIVWETDYFQDFQCAQDFERYTGTDQGIVSRNLGSDGRKFVIVNFFKSCQFQFLTQITTTQVSLTQTNFIIGIE